MDLQKLIDWADVGNRSVRIEINRYGSDNETTAWCFDYNIMEGERVTDTDNLPTTESLTKQAIEAKRSELKELENM